MSRVIMNRVTSSDSTSSIMFPFNAGNLHSPIEYSEVELQMRDAMRGLKIYVSKKIYEEYQAEVIIRDVRNATWVSDTSPCFLGRPLVLVEDAPDDYIEVRA